MLRIGSIRWRGKCSKHPGFDPYADGRGAIQGGCDRCSLLADIEHHHTQMLAMMRRFAPPKPERRANMKSNLTKSDSQRSLFEEF